MRRFYVLCLLGLFFLSGIQLYAYDFKVNGLYYNINSDNKTVSVVSGDVKYQGDIVIPSSVRYNNIDYVVTSVSGFDNCYNVTSLSISHTITSIKAFDFMYCSGLVSIVVDGNNPVYDSRNGCNAIIETANNKLILGCRNTVIPNTVEIIGDRAFCGCTGLTEITIPNSVVSLEEYVFTKSHLTSITIPSNLTSIDLSAFYICNYLTNIVVEKGNPIYDARDNCNAIIETATNTLYIGCKNSTIPRTVETIGRFAFTECSYLTSIDIPNNVKRIEKCAFQSCSLSSLYIPASVDSIEYTAFQNNDFLSIQVDSNNHKYDSRNNCNAIIESITNCLIVGCKNTVILNSVKSIGRAAFHGCNSITSITIPNNVTSIGNSAFAWCRNLTSVIIGENVAEIGSYAFESCNALSSITFPNRLMYLGDRAFNKTAWLDNQSSGLVYAGNMAYIYKGEMPPNTSVIIKSGTLGISNSAFQNCTGLVSITFPNSLLTIGYWSFYGCSSLKDVISEIKTPFEISENVFSVYSTAKLTVPQGTKPAYQSTNYWNKFTNIVEAKADNTFGEVADVVDLGLSVKWASWNIGASKIGDYGGLYGAGDPTGKKTSTNVSDYYFNDGGSICGTEYDLAHVKWGDLWRMPKWSELEELKTKCTWTNGEVDGVKGSWVKGPNGNSIFLPWAGNRKGTSTFSGKGSYGYYWSGDMGVSLHSYGYKDLDIGSGGVNQTDGAENYWGQSIRPVYGDSNNGSNTSTKRTIHVATAGTLPNLISESEKYTIEELTLTGELNGTDFRLLRDMAGCNYLGDETSGQLKVLDISETRVVIGGERYVDTDHLPGSGGSFRYTVDKNDVLPQWIFAGCKFTSVSIPNSVTSIGSRAFSSCRGLTSISIPNSVTSIGSYAFSSCRGLTSISIPNSVTSIGEGAFKGCSGLTSISIPNSVTSIGYYAFFDCSGLTSISIPNSVTSIGDGAFFDCRGLTSIKVESGNNVYDSRNNCNAIIKKSTNELIAGCKNTVIPNSVTSIGNYAFSGCSGLTSISIPNSVTRIGNDAFSSCSGLTSISIPNSVTSIGNYAFSSCSGLTSISIPNSVTSIGSYAFRVCSGLTSISIPNSVTSIRNSAFERCRGLTSIKVESGNNVYDSRNNCNAIIKKSTNELIAGCKNTVIPNSVTSIGDYAFYGCSGLTSISIPNSVTSIGSSAFYYCSGLTSISIPNSVTSIGNSAFSDCSGLTSISIPNSVTSIGNYAFYYCRGLKDVISEIKTPFEISENVFSVYSTAKLTVPSGTKSAYQSTAGWNKFTNIVESTNSGDNTGTKRTIHVATAGTLPNLILESEKYTIEELTLTGELNGTDFRLLRDMAGCNYLGEKTSGKLAVLDMTNAKIVAGGEKYLDTDKIYGKGGVNSSGSFHYGINNSDAIPDYVFCGCYLKEMHIPNSVTSIGNQAFSLWSGPTSITIPNSVKSIGDYAFFSCLGLTSITIPNSVMSIGSGAFRYCSGLKDVISEIKTPFEISENVFSVYSTAKLTVPKGTKSAYLSTSSWNKFSTIIEAEGGNVETEVTFASNGITYKGTIATQLGEVIAVGSNSKNLEIPSTVSYDGKSYSVTSIKNGALDGLTLNYLSIPSSVTSLDNTIFSNCDLGALIWKANNALSSNVFSNAKFSTASNFLLYVNSASYAPSNVKNVVVGTSANTILLSDNGGNFYCPKEFTAQYISYSHNYSMKTGGNGKGWETLALPFDVQKIEHKTKGTLTPFAKYNSADDSQRPFWLYEFGSNGFKRTDAIKANTPYIIAMPNDSKYDEEYIITGDVTFSATNAQVYETESLVKPSSNGKTFAPAFAAVNSSSSVYALNVSNDLTYYSGPYDAGSRFVSNLRNIYPFEAYMTTSSSGARALAIEFEDDATGIEDIPIMYRSEGRVKVYNLTGLLMFSVPQSDFAEKWKYLPSGVYIVNGQKMIKSDDVQYNLVY